MTNMPQKPIQEILDHKGRTMIEMTKQVSELHDVMGKEKDALKKAVRERTKEERTALKDRIGAFRIEALENEGRHLEEGKQKEATEKASALEKFFEEVETESVQPRSGTNVRKSSDILSPSAAQNDWKRTINDFLERIHAGTLIEMYVSFRRALIDIPLPFFKQKDPAVVEKQLRAIEKFSGTWFGASKLQGKMRDYLKEKNSKLVLADGSEDADTYADLKVTYQLELDKQLKNAASPEGKDAIQTKYSFDSVIRNKMDEYLELQAVQDVLKDSSKKYVATITDVMTGFLPHVATAPTKKDDPKDQNGGFFASLFSSFTSFRKPKS